MSEIHDGEHPRLVVGAIIVRDGLVLAARRSRPAELAGKYEFPGGKVEAGEQPEAALVREIREELGVEVGVDAELESLSGHWPIGPTMNLRVWFCELVEDEPAPGESHDQIVWCSLAALPELDWLPADQPVADALAALADQP